MCQERLHNTFPLEIVAYTVFGIVMLLLYTRRRHSLALHLRPRHGRLLLHHRRPPQGVPPACDEHGW